MNDYSFPIAKAGIALVALVTLLTPYSFGFGWILNGNVINAATCAPIVGANVSSPYNNFAFNITNKVGNYSLPLGTGNWTVTVKATGYSSGSFLTPYESAGGLTHNFALVPTGGSTGSCLSGISNETVINSTKTTVTPGVNPNVTTSAPSTNVTSVSQPSGGLTSDVVVAVIVIIIIAVVAYSMTRKKKGHMT